ncbi:PqiC family protein [Rheinheimera baltica]|uniref:PqiC family protein n=1 Tax=Rheinheimera baltica TaxID=67576 RepID=UPI00273E0478|nr:ABC-type transport auxiliary lipoprotein family protein [Rheinheimera baltica]MDP5143917.1 ABC-type transport auxiliary lipoprotein family protein [Rheinheimera baltica]MDP5151655.1 ABC-type transport auxiliary lipoprotein family protein [Rheinheimera baltica]MDP5190054.1 ABC-type transport auxiliary lipoprotein family protein [Rheinheimera baltica]
MRRVLLGCVLLFVGCSSQQAITYYQLPVMPALVASQSTATQQLYIEPVQVASYLNGRGLVLQVSDVELVVARQHLWAEALGQQLQRQLRDRLQPVLPEFVTVLQAQPTTMRLAVQIDQFHGQADGYAIISGRFTLSTHPGSEAFSLRVPLEDDGYPALVVALGQGLQLLSQQISQQLNAAI